MKLSPQNMNKYFTTFTFDFGKIDSFISSIGIWPSHFMQAILRYKCVASRHFGKELDQILKSEWSGWLYQEQQQPIVMKWNRNNNNNKNSYKSQHAQANAILHGSWGHHSADGSPWNSLDVHQSKACVWRYIVNTSSTHKKSPKNHCTNNQERIV